MSSILEAEEWSYVDTAPLKVAGKISRQMLLEFHQNPC